GLVLQQVLDLALVEPHAVAMRALVDLDAVPLSRDQVISAFRALHAVRATLGFGLGLPGGLALLAQQLGVPPGEVLLFVLAGLLRHGSRRRGWTDGQRVASGSVVRLCRPRRGGLSAVEVTLPPQH